MISMTAIRAEKQGTSPVVVAGVDTHQRTHHAAVLTESGILLGSREFCATRAGYQQLLDWVAGYGPITAIGVESTGSYGAGLTVHLLVAGVEVIEVNRPDKATRARRGKSDAIDAESAARAVLAGTATARPKLKTGVVEAIRAIKVPRDRAVKDRTAAFGQLRDLITTAPSVIHDELIGLSGRRRVAKALGYRPDTARLEDPTQATKHGLRTLARRIRALDAEIDQADEVLAALTKRAAPTLLAMHQVGVQTTAQLVITAGQNIDRMRSEASFARLCGVAPIPASSGHTSSGRVRLNPGGDRQANCALYMIVTGRLATHPETQAYFDRRTSEHKTTAETIRCLKRHLARGIYRTLKTDLMTT
jgi:transposase